MATTSFGVGADGSDTKEEKGNRGVLEGATEGPKQKLTAPPPKAKFPPINTLHHVSSQREILALNPEQLLCVTNIIIHFKVQLIHCGKCQICKCD